MTAALLLHRADGATPFRPLSARPPSARPTPLRATARSPGKDRHAMSAGRVSFIGEVDVARFPHTETIVVAGGRAQPDAVAGAAPLVLRRGEGAVIAMRHRTSHPGRIAHAQFVFCAAAAELANQPGITPLRAEANFKPSNSLPAEILLGPAHRSAAATTSSRTSCRAVVAGTWDSTPYHRIVRAHRLNEFMYPAGRQRAVRGPRWQRAVRRHRRCAVRAAGRTRSAGKAAIAWRSSTCAKPSRLKRRQSPSHVPATASRRDFAQPASPCRRRRDRRRDHRCLHRLLPGPARAVGRRGRKGPHRRRTIEPQLGLVPPAEPRRARTAHVHPQPRAVGSVCRRQRRRHGLQALRLAVPQQRRSPDCRLGQVARVRDDGWRDHAHAQRPRGLGARPGDRPRVERRRLLTQRRHGRSGPGGASRGRRAHETRRHRAPELRRARHRDGGWPAQRRRDRSRDHQDPHRGARRRCVGVVVLQPARRAVSGGHDSPIDGPSGTGRAATAGRPHQPTCGHHPPPRRPLHPGHQRPRARRPHGAAGALRATVPADVRQALAQRVSRRPGRHALGSRNPGEVETGRTHTDGTGAHPRYRPFGSAWGRSVPPDAQGCEGAGH